MAIEETIKLADPSLFKETLFIGGEWVESSDGMRSKVINPATGKVIAEVAMATKLDIERAISLADAAFKVWSKMTALERAKILRTWFNLIIENVNDLAQILTCEQGKPLDEARAGKRAVMLELMRS